MKILSSILIVIIMTLSFIPCCANDKCTGQEGFCFTNNNFNNDKNDNFHIDFCSPFFNCDSCTGFIVSIKLHIDNPLQILPEKKFHLSGINCQIKTVFSFFHPPKS